jgi:hypothetical protein
VVIFITLVPTRRNDGSAVRKRELDAVLDLFWQRFGGATIERGIEGHWVDMANGRHYHEQSVRVTVNCPAERLAEAEALVLEIGRQLGQKAMYFDVRYYDGVRILRVPE